MSFPVFLLSNMIQNHITSYGCMRVFATSSRNVLVIPVLLVSFCTSSHVQNVHEPTHGPPFFTSWVEQKNHRRLNVSTPPLLTMQWCRGLAFTPSPIVRWRVVRMTTNVLLFEHKLGITLRPQTLVLLFDHKLGTTFRLRHHQHRPFMVEEAGCPSWPFLLRLLHLGKEVKLWLTCA